ncbi:UDP-glucose 4-epimerase [Copromyces sp. CBS 386.78]|uniref:DNA-directed RNA polymerases I, II, and III subunit RPABC3 n=1 Tax=Pseudoneurospora amorphoporcata TaxID=241081 RepID=A0AAN6P3T4_9PEZI|nr:UDP-glucose 4-epimerase [Copromyces sp. CBS 386.78]KAK3955103.1 UDP-glucose 4-epimerase [Pseudoneurospora amorphoporcata]
MSALTSDAQLFEDEFKVERISDPKYDRVDRLYCTSTDGQTSMQLDINKELFPVKVGEYLRIALATSLSLDGSKDDERGWRDAAKLGSVEQTLADSYEYVCHGKVYKFEDGKDGQTIKAYMSYGGLLMALDGPYKKLTPLRVDYIYLLATRNT